MTAAQIRSAVSTKEKSEMEIREGSQQWFLLWFKGRGKLPEEERKGKAPL